MIDLDILARLRAYTCCEPDSQPLTHAELGALLAELDAIADAAPTIGGPIPEPWPGMGVEFVDGVTGRIDRMVCDPAQVGGIWYAVAVGERMDAEDIADACCSMDEANAIYDGRRCIWRRE